MRVSQKKTIGFQSRNHRFLRKKPLVSSLETTGRGCSSAAAETEGARPSCPYCKDTKKQSNFASYSRKYYHTITFTIIL